MRFFKIMEEQQINRIKAKQKSEYELASIFRIGVTAVSVLGWGVSWFITGNYDSPFLYFVLMIAFYWFWFQIGPRIEHEWEREEEQKQLHFVRLLYKYVDANGLEDEFENLSKRVAELEARDR